MARVTRAAAHLPVEEVGQRMKAEPRALARQRWLIIYNALVEPRKAEEIARHGGVSKAVVHQVICTYNRLGPGAIETAGKGGRRHQYLTLQEERNFLAPFFAQAQRGEIAPAAEIWHAFEARTGHPVDESTVYRLLNRHGWRKLMPRPKPLQARGEEQERFKNTVRHRWRPPSRPAQPTISGPS
ncbi:MAG TPA: winged helix-turn-helix domain-containing protein [Ktedonobacteraceae bacterium]|jgi:transposase|nr:winged helix-turn-helix domain-containing protein [Ktedonobacteraceae bacterium]